MIDACKAGDSAKVLDFLLNSRSTRRKAGALRFEERGSRMTALHWAAFKGLAPVVKEILAVDSDLRLGLAAARSAAGSTLLHLAAYGGHEGVTKV